MTRSHENFLVVINAFLSVPFVCFRASYSLPEIRFALWNLLCEMVLITTVRDSNAFTILASSRLVETAVELPAPLQTLKQCRRKLGGRSKEKLNSLTLDCYLDLEKENWRLLFDVTRLFLQIGLLQLPVGLLQIVFSNIVFYK